MENEIMINEEVVDGVAEVTTVDSKKGLIAIGATAAAVLGVIIYKKVIKPKIAKRKAMKQNTEIEADYEEPVNDQEDSEEI